MDLKAGKVFWKDTFEARKYPMWRKTCQVVFVQQGGSSGAHWAYFLAETGLIAVLIDKRDISDGSTVANTGLLQFSNDKTLTPLISSLREETGTRHVFNPDFKIRKSLYYASNPMDVSKLKEEYSNLKTSNFPVEYYTEKDINWKFSFPKAGDLVTDNDAEINPINMHIY